MNVLKNAIYKHFRTSYRNESCYGTKNFIGVEDADFGGGQDDALAKFAGLFVDTFGGLEEALDGYESALVELLHHLGVLGGLSAIAHLCSR